MRASARWCAAIRRPRAQLGQTVGQIGLRLHSHFAPLVPDPTARLLAEACALHARSALAGRPEADWPVLGAAPAFGAHPGGPVLDLPPGNIRLADLQRICPFPNTVVAFRITGAGLRDWLEHAAGVFCTARPGTHNQPLLHPEQPLYTFDLIEGLEYEIDLTRARGSRITRLHHAGAIVAAHDRFILATNNYRASGGVALRRSRMRICYVHRRRPSAASWPPILAPCRSGSRAGPGRGALPPCRTHQCR